MFNLLNFSFLSQCFIINKLTHSTIFTDYFCLQLNQLFTSQFPLIFFDFGKLNTGKLVAETKN